MIESCAFKPNTFLDDTGLPHGDKWKVTERLPKIGDKTVEAFATVEDSEM